MGCGHSIFEDDEIQMKLKEKKDQFMIDKENYEKLKKNSKHSVCLEERAANVNTEEEFVQLVEDEALNILNSDLSKPQGISALHLLIAKKVIKKNIISNMNIKRFVGRDQFTIFQSIVDEDDMEYVQNIGQQLNLPGKDNSQILTYSGKYYKNPFLEKIVSNLKHDSEFYLPNCMLYLVKSDLQNSQRMIDLGEVIDYNANIRNLLVYLEPILPEDYKHSKSKNPFYTANCSNLSYFFDAINKSLTLDNLAFVCDQRVNMKFTKYALNQFFSIFENPKCTIESLVLINIDIVESEIYRFHSLFKKCKSLKYFIYQPPWQTDSYLSKMTDCIKISKSLKFVVFFHGRKCSDEQIEKSSTILTNSLKLHKVLFEDNYYYLRTVKKKMSGEVG